MDKGYIISCTNSRSSDLKAAAKANNDNIPKVADGVKLYIAAASVNEQVIAEEESSWQTLLDAGAIALPASCGPCVGLGAGLLEDGASHRRTVISRAVWNQDSLMPNSAALKL